MSGLADELRSMVRAAVLEALAERDARAGAGGPQAATERLETPAELAAAGFGSEAFLRGLARAGRVPAVRVGRTWRIRRGDVEKALAAPSSSPAAGSTSARVDELLSRGRRRRAG